MKSYWDCWNQQGKQVNVGDCHLGEPALKLIQKGKEAILVLHISWVKVAYECYSRNGHEGVSLMADMELIPMMGAAKAHRGIGKEPCAIQLFGVKGRTTRPDQG